MWRGGYARIKYMIAKAERYRFDFETATFNAIQSFENYEIWNPKIYVCKAVGLCVYIQYIPTKFIKKQCLQMLVSRINEN